MITEGTWDLSSKKNLEYTSLEVVEGAVTEKLQLESMEDPMEGVLSRLDGKRAD